jgi:hypothetical protein
MSTIYELSDPHENYLLPILARGPGVCPICHTSVTGTFVRCRSCNRANKDLSNTANALGFISLAVKGEQLDQELRYYKKESQFPSRAKTEDGLSAVLWRWLKTHEVCVESGAGVESFPIVTTIPSTRGRTSHPLSRMVGERIGITRDRFRPLLIANPDFPESKDRDFSPDRFKIQGSVERGVPVLIIDDTFTTGSSVQSAACLLKGQGSGPIGVVCIGRHFVVNQEGEFGIAAQDYLRQSRTLGWDWNYCNHCDERVL